MCTSASINTVSILLGLYFPLVGDVLIAQLSLELSCEHAHFLADQSVVTLIHNSPRYCRWLR